MRYNLFIFGLIILSIFYNCTTTIKSVREEIIDSDKNNTEENLAEDVSEKSESDEYSPSEEEYTVTFNEISAVIEKLNKIIRNKEYNIWFTYLTDDYIQEKGDRDYLKELSNTPVILNQKIELLSLKDYFYYVVVPSRYNVKVDKISFIDKMHVKAYTYINKEFVILYYLEKQNDEWKIGSR